MKLQVLVGGWTEWRRGVRVRVKERGQQGLSSWRGVRMSTSRRLWRHSSASSNNSLHHNNQVSTHADTFAHLALLSHTFHFTFPCTDKGA